MSKVNQADRRISKLFPVNNPTAGTTHVKCVLRYVNEGTEKAYILSVIPAQLSNGFEVVHAWSGYSFKALLADRFSRNILEKLWADQFLEGSVMRMLIDKVCEETVAGGVKTDD